MKKSIPIIFILLALAIIPKLNYGQIVLGNAAARFAIFTNAGAVSDNASANSLITGDVGTSTVGPITGFGNVNGVMHPGANLATAACFTALTATIAQLNLAPATLFPSATMGSGVTLTPGVYSIPGNATLTLNLFLDAQSNPDAQFIIKIGGTFNTNTNSKVILVGGAKACNVYWQITGAVSMASLTTMRGNIISGGAINMGSGDSLEGRAFSTVGLIAINGITAFTPTGCGSPTLNGPKLPNMRSIACYTIFSSSGALVNSVGTSSVIGDVGNNGGGTITGWAPAAVTGTLRTVPDSSTIKAAADLSRLHDTLNAMPIDIELLFPSKFGRNLTLTPHVYLLNSGGANGPAVLTDSLYLDAQNNPNGVFVIKITAGALTTSTFAKVKLINGAQAKNVFWLVQGAVSINNFSVFKGTFVVPVGAVNLVNTGIVLDGRVLTMNGAITTSGLTATMPPACGVAFLDTQPINQTVCSGDSAIFSISTTQTGLTYRWRKGVVNLTDNANISGSTTTRLRIFPATIADTSSRYFVQVFGSDTSNSDTVSLRVNLPPNITQEPINKKACIGDSTYMVVKATGTNITYQWRKGLVNIKDTLNYSGATTDSLKIRAILITDTASNYNVIISGTCAPRDSSITVSLRINTAPQITVEPTNKNVCLGSTVLFTVSLNDSGLTYRWRKNGVDLINGPNITGVSSDTLRILNVTLLDTSTFYNVIVTGNCSLRDTSVFAKLSIGQPPIITRQPVATSACLGASVRFIVAANGDSLTYQWRKGNVNLIDTGSISGSTNDTIVIVPTRISDTTGLYSVIITGNCAANVISDTARLIINQSPVITAEPTNAIGCVGESVIFVVKASGANLTYRWRKGLTILKDTLNYSGTTDDTLRISSITQTDTSDQYNVVVTGACIPADSSIFARLSINPPPIIITEPSSLTPCIGQSALFVVRATGSNLTYQWRKGLVNIKDTLNYLGATDDTLRISSITQADTSTQYNVLVTGTCAPADISNFVQLNVGTPPSVVLQPLSQSSCEGTSVSLNGTGTGSFLTYQWRRGTINLIDTGSISGSNTNQLTINPIRISDAGSTYNLLITGSCSPAVQTANAAIVVNNAPIALAGGNQTVCLNDTIELVAQTVIGATYQWSGPNAFSSVAQNPIILNATAINQGIYSLVVTSNGCNSLPSTVNITVGNCNVDLLILKTSNLPRPLINREVVFTIQVTNNGTTNATGVSVTDILRNGFTYISSTTTVGSYTSTTGVWDIGDLNVGQTVTATITAKVNAEGNHSNTATVSGNESDLDLSNNASTIQLNPTDFFIPQGFSPNADGVNDLFVIRGIEFYPTCSINIYNRWGSLVYDANPYKSQWDGKANNGLSVGEESLPIGTYFYVLDLGDGSNNIKGTIYLNK